MPRTIPEEGITIGMVEDGVLPAAGEDPDLAVLDWCTEPFLDEGETEPDGALVSLPSNPDGYAVYARITGKPGGPKGKSQGKGKKKGAGKGKQQGKGKGVQQATADDWTAQLAISGDLLVLSDPATGEALVLLGTVDESGVFTPDGSSDGGEEVLVRVGDGPGKGVVKATDLSGLFQFDGTVCTLAADTTAFCAAAEGEPECQAYCCVSESPDGGTTPPDATIDRCSPLVDDGDPATPLECPASDPATAVYTPAQCKTYEDTWVFEIQSLAQYLWALSGGAYNVQVRFYPQ